MAGNGNPYSKRTLSTVGEVIESNETLTALDAALPTDINSVTLPAGTWILYGSVYAVTNEIVALLQYLQGQISDVSENLSPSPYLSQVDFGGQSNCGLPFSYKPVVITVETTFYLTIACQVAVTGSIYGNLSAIRFK